MPEKAFEKFNRRIMPQWKICFLAAFAVGLIAHLYKITNWLPNWDSLVFRYDGQNMTALGRWFLPVVCAFSSFYDLPFLNGLMAIVFHALGAVCICEIAGVKKGVSAFLTGAVVASFPTVTSVLMYNYVADGYAIAFYMACLAAVLLTTEKPGYVWAVVMITLSVAIYQAYITVTAMLLLLSMTNDLVFGKKEAAYVLKRGLRFLAAGIAGMVMYYVILNIILKISGTELLDYQGMSSAASGGGIDIMASLYVIKQTFVNYFFDFSKGINLFAVTNAAIALLTGVGYLLYCVKNKVLLSPAKVLLLALVAVFVLIAPAILALINAQADYHNLMCMGYCVFYIFFIMLYEHGDEFSEKFVSAEKWTVLTVCAVLIFSQVLIANISWHKAQMAYERSYGLLVRIADRIEQNKEAQTCNEILVVGAPDGSEAYSSVLPPDITGITDGLIIRADDETVAQSVLCSALNDYCSKDYSFVSGKRKEELLKKEEIKNMSTWPLDGSVGVTDGIVVIRFE